MVKEQKTVDRRHARDTRYNDVLANIEESGVCPFCPAHFKWHTEPILQNDGGWLITKNFKPYENAEYHFLIIGDTHKEELSEITQDDLKSVHTLANWAVEEYCIEGGALIIRFGNTTHTGATVRHLHFHLISPNVTDKESACVSFPVG